MPRGLVPLLVKSKKRGPRPAHWKSGGRPRMVAVTLSEPHTSNGVRYGPGEVRVPEAMAREFTWAEDRIAEARRRYLEPQDHLINLRYGSNGALVTSSQIVPPGYFDSGMDQTDVWRGHAEPALHLRGPGR